LPRPRLRVIRCLISLVDEIAQLQEFVDRELWQLPWPDVQVMGEQAQALDPLLG
jgi:hypothetical protein